MKLIKRLFILLVVLVLLVVGGSIYAVMRADALVKVGIEKGGTHATGVETKVDSVDVGLLSGTAQLKGLRMANPPGFKQPSFFALGDGALAVSLNSLRSDTVEVPSIKLSNITMSLERNSSGTNYGVILDNLKKLGGNSSGGSSGGGKQVLVKEIELKNITVVADLVGAPGDLTKLEVPIDSIRLTDVGSAGAKKMEVADIAATVVQAILQAVVDKGGLPADLLGDLQGRLASLTKLGDFKLDAAVGPIKDLSGTVKDAGKKAGEAIQQVGDQIKKAPEDIKKVGEDIKGLIPKKKGGG